MTKYILHGGETGLPNEHNKAFYQEWVKDFQPGIIPTILLSYFAREKAEWPKLEQEDRERFARYTNNRQVSFMVADSNLDTLREQIKVADVIYVRGGSVDKVIQAFTPLKDELSALLNGKVYAGSSAGVMALARYALSPEEDWCKGLGLLPVNVVVHWSEEFRKSLESFKESYKGEGGEYLLIPETEFMVR
ncbi:MAG: Type 1 glutamine amidotransferase-like domain-containing protein [Candidatus Veblenbacteria bacterium]|nr:Type 1 glutamine amidotransferase-like domain-containing protein [Candidatus Veblenbacteria bacterium]